jgi:hypothetical protein
VEELVAAAKEFGAEYIVDVPTQEERYLQTGLVEVVDRSQSIVVFRIL